MTSEIRVNKLENRVGLGTIEYSNTGPVISGVTTASNFKTGSSNLHSSGVEVAGVNVLGADTPIGLGATIYNSGAAVFTGVVTATSFSGSGDLDVDGHTNLDNVSIAGILTVTKGNSGGATPNTDSVLTLDNSSHNYIQFRSPNNKEQGLLFGDDADNDAGNIIYNHSNNALTFSTNGGASEKLRITSSGRIGIGSDDPGATLDLFSDDTEILLRLNTKPVKNGYLDIVSDANRRGVIRFRDSLGDGGNYRWSIGNGDSDELTNTSFHISSGNSGGNAAKFVINSSGNIGINETAPSEKLQIDGDILLGGQANSSESNYAIKFEYNNHQFAKIVGDGRDSTGYGDIDFYTSSGSGVSNLTQRMSIRANGYIGIGDFTSVVPDSMLHINGISATAQIRLQRTNAAANTNDYGRIYFESTDNVLTGEISVARESAENNGYMHFNTASGGTLVERLRITSAGVVSVNTPSLLNAFEINYGGGFNLVLDGGGNIKHYRANGSNGGLNLTTALTSGSWGTGGGFIALKPNGVTNGLLVDKDGRVMIGTSTQGVATGDEFTVATDEHTGITIRSGSSHEGNIFFGDGGAGSAGIIRYEHNNDAMVFKTNSTGQERLRIDSSGNVKVVARGSNTSGAPFYVAVTGKSDISYAGGNDDTACLRIVDNGSNNSYYHGLELRSRQGADVRLYCQDQGNDLSHFVIATDNSSLLERARFTQYGLHLQPYTTDSANSGYPISTFTDGGTRFATHLATMSGYSGNGEIIVITQFSDHSGGSEMFSVRITGYWYSSSTGGAIDCVVGAYAGEGSYHNATVTGTYPVNWRDKIKFASITSGNNQGKMCIRLGAVGSANDCELAFTDCTHGFYGVNQSKTSGWRVIKVNDQSVINSTYNGTVRTCLHRSNEIYNDEFQVVGAGSGELLTNRPGQGGTIMGMYQYTQYNQGLNYEHLIRSPHGHTDLTDSYCDRNWMALISASVDGTSTVDTGTTYFCQDNSDDNNSLQITNKFGYSGSGSSNRIFMVVNNGRVAWKMNHGGGYRISVTVQFLAGGKQNGTYNTADTSYQAN